MLIFKSITNRDDDLDDCMSLIENGEVDWDVSLEEIRHQTETGEDVWITWIADRLYTLSEISGLDIPILDDVNAMADDYLKRWEKDLLEKAGLDERSLSAE